MRNDCIFFCPIRVRFGEVDRQGIVYNGNYVIYTDAAICEFFRSRGYSYKELAEKHDSEICHKKATYEFFSSAFEDDLLEVGVRVVHIGNRSFTMGFEIYRQGEDELLVYSESVYVGYDMENRCSRPLTDVMRKILGA